MIPGCKLVQKVRDLKVLSSVKHVGKEGISNRKITGVRFMRPVLKT